MKVIKFGGSSVGSPEIIRKVKEIVEQHEQGTVVVFSAFQGVTDHLIRTAQLARSRDKNYKNEIQSLIKRHIDIIQSLFPSRVQNESILKKTETLLAELEEIFNGVYLLKDYSLKTMDYILSFGERLSSFILSEFIENALWMDARLFIKTDHHYGNAKVNFEQTDILIKKHFEKINQYIIVPGFIASTADNETTTLGRGGSDYTAAIIAAALDAKLLEIWTDVDGFMTADPRVVEKAYPIEVLTYAEAMELSHFGAKVVYTPTIKPVYVKNIPVVVKNTFNPQARGTIIGQKDNKKNISPIKGISSINQVTLLTLQGAGLVGAAGTSMRLFGALAKSSINIIFITQASSEYSITFAVSPTDAEEAVEAIGVEFVREIREQQTIKLVVENNLSIIAIVGEEMKNTPGISATLFRSLGRNGINVIATAQGSSELNISVVVSQSSLKKAMNVIHEAFFLTTYVEMHLYMIGIGNVGGSLLRQIQKQQSELLKEHHLRINLAGVMDIDKMIIKESGLTFENYPVLLKSEGVPTNHDELVRKIREFNLPNSVVVDCTASYDVARLYEKILESYCSVVTSNKIACSSDYKLYDNLIRTARKKGVRFLYETNVGAGLPIIKTIDDLMNSGDKIVKIEAVLSGTLNFIFNVLSPEIPMSKAIRMAQEKGYSEPDPRIDLGGVDVGRKILILTRQAGYAIEMNEVDLKPFLPESCFKGSMDEFWTAVEKLDGEFEKQRMELDAKKLKWRFMAKMENGKAGASLQAISESHPAYHLEGSNNIIMITTDRYKDHPMVIKGYGAGAEVTAAGVFADIIRIANI